MISLCSTKGAVRPVVIVEALPHSQLLLETHVAAISMQLVELVLVGPVRSLDSTVQLRRPRLDVGVFHAQVCNVSVKERLELVAAIDSDGAYPERELLHDVVMMPWKTVFRSCGGLSFRRRRCMRAHSAGSVPDPIFEPQLGRPCPR
jgi:hypothetical protein